MAFTFLRPLSAAAAAATQPPPEIFGVRLFTDEVRTVLSVLAGAGLFGGIVAAVGSRNDAHVQRLEEKLLHVEASVAKQLDGASDTMRAEVAGVRAEARAAALEVLKDYGVAVAGGKAGAAPLA